MKLRHIALTAVTLNAACLGTAGAATPMCRNGNFSATYDASTLRLATVPGRTPLYEDFNGCPAGGDRCRQGNTSAITAGSTVIVAPPMPDGWVCAYVPPGGKAGASDAAGYVRQEALKLQEPSPVAAKDFVGQWETGPNGNQIRIAAGKAGALTVAGAAFWPARSEPKHTGTLRGEAMPANATLRVAGGGCNVRMDMLSPSFLVVADLSGRGSCSGANATFTGVYRRVK